MKKYSRVFAKIDLGAVRNNFLAMKEKLRDGTKIIAVVKADGYGHGAVPIARMAEPWDFIWGFAAATVEEAVELRLAGIKKPILILGCVFEEDYEKLTAYGIRPTVFQLSAARELSKTAVRTGTSLPVHLAVDTGMSRIGFADTEESVKEIEEMAKLPGLVLEGIFTHFARADEKDKSDAVSQLNRYLRFIRLLQEAGISIPLRHCSNSAGILEMPEANMDAVRAGISMYGIYPSDEMDRNRIRLEPAMELKSHIVYIKEVPAGVPVSYGGTFVTDRPTRIATIPVGYADGYPRSLSSRGCVLIRGKRAPIIGRICMDQFMADVTDIPAEELDEVTLMGRDGEEFLSVDELGALSGRFPYEFVCDISKRVPRIYVNEQ